MAFQYDPTDEKKFWEISDPERRISLRKWFGPVDPGSPIFIYTEDGDEKMFQLKWLEDDRSGKRNRIAIVENTLLPELRCINGRLLSEEEAQERLRIIAEGLVLLYEQVDIHYKVGARDLEITFIPRADSPAV